MTWRAPINHELLDKLKTAGHQNLFKPSPRPVQAEHQYLASRHDHQFKPPPIYEQLLSSAHRRSSEPVFSPPRPSIFSARHRLALAMWVVERDRIVDEDSGGCDFCKGIWLLWAWAGKECRVPMKRLSDLSPIH
ncbi:hypothetical protein ACFE04_025816 [Oxalis oulophora]